MGAWAGSRNEKARGVYFAFLSKERRPGGAGELCPHSRGLIETGGAFPETRGCGTAPWPGEGAGGEGFVGLCKAGAPEAPPQGLVPSQIRGC